MNTWSGPALDVQGVVVRFGAVEALRGVDLAVDRGQILGLVGPNGAGKTTLLDVVTGYVRPVAGTIALAGRPVHRLRPHRRAQAGVRRTFQSAELFDDLTVLENLAVARSHSAPPAGAIADRFGLGAHVAMLARDLPAGVRRQVDLARAVAGGPQVLLLDEPGAGLHHDEVDRLAGQLRSIAADGVAVVVVDHDLALIAETCDQLIVLDFGSVIEAGPPAEVLAASHVAEAYLGA